MFHARSLSLRRIGPPDVPRLTLTLELIVLCGRDRPQTTGGRPEERILLMEYHEYDTNCCILPLSPADTPDTPPFAWVPRHSIRSSNGFPGSHLRHYHRFGLAITPVSASSRIPKQRNE